MTRPSRRRACWRRTAMSLALLASGCVPPAAGAQQIIEPTPKTVTFGSYDATARPVTHVASGGRVRLHTLIVASPQQLEGAGLPPDKVEQALRDIHGAVRGSGPHILTGPVYVEGAEPGDVLEVRIRSVEPAIDYAINAIGGSMGLLGEEFPTFTTRVVPLDLGRGVAMFAEGIEIPLRPFFGSMGVAPAGGPAPSGPPWTHGGNLDNKELVAGTTLFLPVHVAGALFWAGDGHAAQGDGEVDLTALETSLRGEFEFIVRKDLRLTWPRAETPSSYITMGFDTDLTAAARLAAREMIDLITTRTRLSRAEAYRLVSVAVDLRITQLVDGNVGVHAVLPKAIVTTPAR